MRCLSLCVSTACHCLSLPATAFPCLFSLPVTACHCLSLPETVRWFQQMGGSGTAVALRRKGNDNTRWLIQVDMAGQPVTVDVSATEAETAAGGGGGGGGGGEGSWSMQQPWTVLHYIGPNHPGLWSNQAGSRPGCAWRLVPRAGCKTTRMASPATGSSSRRREFCHSAAPPSTCSRCVNRDGERASAK